MRLAGIVAPIFALLFWSAAVAQPADRSEEARESVAQALYASQATADAAARQSDDRLRELQRQIDVLRQQRDASRRTLAELQEQYVQALAHRDRAYAEEISVFRNALQNIAQDPARLAALQRYNAGDTQGALAVLDELDAATGQALQVRRNIELAALRRQTAVLAYQAHEKGLETTPSLLRRMEEITSLDATYAPDWIVLGDSLVQLGQLDASQRAYEHGASLRQDDRGTALFLERLEDSCDARNDYVCMRQYAERDFTLRRSIAEANPRAVDDQIELAESYAGLAVVAMREGRPDRSLVMFDERLTVYRSLLAQNAANNYIRDRTALAFYSSAEAHTSLRHFDLALPLYEEALNLRKQIAASDPGLATEGFVAWYSIRVAQTLMNLQRFAEATPFLDQALPLARREAEGDPANVPLQDQLATALAASAANMDALGDRRRAIALCTEAVAIMRHSASASPRSPDIGHLYWGMAWQLAELGAMRWGEVLSIMNGYRDRSLLPPDDEPARQEAMRRALQESLSAPH